MTFDYVDYNTVNVDGKRLYLLSDEIAYPSITTVLGNTDVEKSNVLAAWRARIGNKQADKISADAAARGTNVHLMLERHLNGEDPRVDEFPKEHVSVYRSIKMALSKINKVHGQEVVLYSHALMVAGRCDLVADYDGEMAIVDYKTSTRVKTVEEIGGYFLQAAFYATAHNEMFGTDIKKLVTVMGIENKLPRIFKKTIDDVLLESLCERVAAFYEKL